MDSGTNLIRKSQKWRGGRHRGDFMDCGTILVRKSTGAKEWASQRGFHRFWYQFNKEIYRRGGGDVTEEISMDSGAILIK